ncbi:rab11 family-interacting protein 2-like isoform X1 [Mauremys mutica]|nr:rab11 family-interacting protein 2-like isoform X1 [Mauremys mutica]
MWADQGAPMEAEHGAQSPRPEVAELEEWQPTHLRVVVLSARSLRAKGGAGSSSPYVVIQLQKQKYLTSVVPHSLTPKWREECTLQLPSRLDDAKEHCLVLTAMHHSLHRPDQFLGRLCLPLAQLFCDKARRRNEWFRLQSRRGRPDKVRGQLQLDLQFMQILSPGSEPAFSIQGPQSLFTKLRSSMKGRRNKVYPKAQSPSLCTSNDEDSSSSSSMPIEPDPSALMARGSAGGSAHATGAAPAAMAPSPCTELRLRTYLSKEVAYEAPSVTAKYPASSSSQPDQWVALEQHPKKKSQLLKEDNAESLEDSPETPQASSPPLRRTQEGGIPPQRSQTLYTFRMSRSHPTSTKPLGTTSGHSCTWRRQLKLLRGCHICLRCFGLRLKP